MSGIYKKIKKFFRKNNTSINNQQEKSTDNQQEIYNESTLNNTSEDIIETEKTEEQKTINIEDIYNQLNIRQRKLFELLTQPPPKSYKELAEALDCKINTVKTFLTKIRKLVPVKSFLNEEDPKTKKYLIDINLDENKEQDYDVNIKVNGEENMSDDFKEWKNMKMSEKAELLDYLVDTARKRAKRKEPNPAPAIIESDFGDEIARAVERMTKGKVTADLAQKIFTANSGNNSNQNELLALLLRTLITQPKNDQTDIIKSFYETQISLLKEQIQDLKNEIKELRKENKDNKRTQVITKKENSLDEWIDRMMKYKALEKMFNEEGITKDLLMKIIEKKEKDNPELQARLNELKQKLEEQEKKRLEQKINEVTERLNAVLSKRGVEDDIKEVVAENIKKVLSNMSFESTKKEDSGWKDVLESLGKDALGVAKEAVPAIAQSLASKKESNPPSLKERAYSYILASGGDVDTENMAKTLNIPPNKAHELLTQLANEGKIILSEQPQPEPPKPNKKTK